MRITKQDLRALLFPDKEWYIIWRKNRLSHREDGPSNIWSDGAEYHHLDSKYYLEHEYWKKIHENY